MNRRRPRRVLLALALLGVGLGVGCLGEAEHTYFHDRLDASSDATTAPAEASSEVDGSTMDGASGTGADDAGGEAAGESDVTTMQDAGADADARAIPPDSAADGGPDAGAFDAGSDCGPPDTPKNCGACGSACDTTHSSTPTCNGATCLYGGCDAGWGDCVKTPPNLNGCETQLNTVTNCTGCGIACDTDASSGAFCNGTTCSYASCRAGFADCDTTPPNANGCETPLSAIKHSTGIPGISYYDCAPLMTYGETQAIEACTAYTGDGSQCASFACANPMDGPIVCSTGALNKDCECWSYGGKNAGYVDNSGGLPGSSGNNCFCPSTSLDPMWN